MSLFSTLSIPEPFLNSLDDAVEFVKRHKRIRVVAHHDADGIASATILTRALIREGKKIHLSFTGNLTEEDVERFSSGRYDAMILADIGSSLLNALPEETLVLDHHGRIAEGEALLVNPHLHGMDGGRDACASAVCFLFASRLNGINEDSYPFALAGILGDKQDLGGYGPVNGAIVRWVSETRDVKVVTELDVDGESIFEALHLSTDPYFPGYSGDSNAINELLDKLGIEGDKAQSELEMEDMRRLISYLAVDMVERGVPPDVVKGIVKDRIHIADMGITANHLSRLLDAAGRTGHHSLPVSFGLGNSWHLESLESIWKTYQNELLHILAVAERSKVDRGPLSLFTVPSRRFTSNVATILSLYYIPERVVIVYAREDDVCHVSARCRPFMCERGIDLGELMALAEEFGGAGGGHRMAAGARVPAGRFDDFMHAVEERLGSTV